MTRSEVGKLQQDASYESSTGWVRYALSTDPPIPLTDNAWQKIITESGLTLGDQAVLLGWMRDKQNGRLVRRGVSDPAAPKVTLFNGQQAFVSDTEKRPFVTSITPDVAQADGWKNQNVPFNPSDGLVIWNHGFVFSPIISGEEFDLGPLSLVQAIVPAIEVQESVHTDKDGLVLVENESEYADASVEQNLTLGETFLGGPPANQDSDTRSFNVGVRYEQVGGAAQEGAFVVEVDAFVPRLGASYDVKGDGRYREAETNPEIGCPVSLPGSYGTDDPLHGLPPEVWMLSAARNDVLTAGDGQWGLQRIGLTRELHEQIVAAKEPAGRPVVVAVIDTGVDLSHPELWGQLWRNRDEIPFNRIDDDGNGYVDDVYGYNTQADNSNVWDDNGHGTAVAGIIAARWDDRGMAGVAPNCRLMIVKAFNQDGRSDSARVALAIRYAVLNGADIIQISAENDQPHEIDQAMVDWATENGVLVIAASGSRGRDTAKISPAGLRGVLTVGACDQEDKRATFSGWGRNVDLVAPGLDVLSLRAHGTDFMFTMAGDALGIKENERVVDERWYRADGTSFSAPLVTGVAAALWAKNPKLTAEQIKNKLIMSCDDVEQPGWDVLTGAGRLNAAKALDADPDHSLHTSVFKTTFVERDGQPGLEVSGLAFGTHFSRRSLQVAYGENPREQDWTTVDDSQQRVTDGSLGFIPGYRFNRRGTWQVRSITEDSKGTTRESRRTVNLR